MNLQLRHEALADDYRATLRALEDVKNREEQMVSLAITLATEYWGVLGKPTADIPVSIQEAHALRGRHTNWKFADDQLLGKRYTEKMAKKEGARVAQYKGAGFGDWEGWWK